MKATMRRRLAAGGSFFFAVNVLLGAPALTGVQRPAALPQSDVATGFVRVDVPRLDADGCTITPIGCNTIATGRLASGDCTTAGKFTDFYVFHGVAGDYVEATIRPLSSSLSRPLVGILPPAGDASKTPIVYGGNEGATAAFLISTTGNWTLAAGTDDLEWFDARDVPTSVGRGATFQTPAVTSKQTYYYTARTACGQVSSRLITVTPVKGRRRSVGR